MGSSYTIGKSLGLDGDSLSLNPHWVLCVVRFKHRTTFSRSQMASQSTDGSEVVAEIEPLIIRSDCQQLNISKGKRQTVGNLVATLKSGEINYLAEITPGDWVLAWIVQSPEEADDLQRRIKAGEICNGELDGLKFVGRVYSIQKLMSLTATGNKRVTYRLQGNSFTEFDSSIYWDPYLANLEPGFLTWMGRLGIAINDFLNTDGVDVNKAIPTLLDILLGKGINKQAANPTGESQLQIATGSTTGEGEAPFAYVVPITVGKLLGKTDPSKPSGIISYADMLNSVFGVQKYETITTSQQQTPSLSRIFSPSTFSPMLGEFLAGQTNFGGKTIWASLNQYLNPAVNEIFTCLRVGPDGHVLPTLVVRQLPFSSEEDLGSARVQTNSVAPTTAVKTSFLELPRWIPADSWVMGYEFSRSDGLRQNFVHLTGQAQAQAVPNPFTFQLVHTPPVRDDQDIRRNGLRADIQTVACGITDSIVGPQKWMDIRADILMGQHMTLSGTLDMFLVQEPICEGDNFEFDGVVFHIEHISHTCVVSEDGRTRHAGTSLQLSYGLRSDARNAERSAGRQPIDEGVNRYAVLDRDDSSTHNPGTTTEGGDTALQTSDIGDFSITNLTNSGIA